MRDNIKLRILFGFAAVILVAVLFVPPIPQDSQYHQFADNSMFWNIPNAWNVVSNLPFLLVGLYGLTFYRYILSAELPFRYRIIYFIYCFGLILISIGSAYYHFSPSNSTLVWDRLPMTVSFMAFFAFIISMHINERVGYRLFLPLLALGIFSVLYWDYTEVMGKGDLRLYAVVQFLPMVLVPIIMLMFPKSAYNQKNIWVLIGIYIVAKAAEFFDQQLYDCCGVGGHALKHIIVAVSTIAFLMAINSINLRR